MRKDHKCDFWKNEKNCGQRVLRVLLEQGWNTEDGYLKDESSLWYETKRVFLSGGGESHTMEAVWITLWGKRHEINSVRSIFMKWWKSVNNSLVDENLKFFFSIFFESCDSLVKRVSKNWTKSLQEDEAEWIKVESKIDYNNNKRKESCSK